MQPQTINELRCFCRRQPLLATYGIDKKGKPYIHIKVYKARRIYGEAIFTDGVVHLHCRECLRWQRISIRTPQSDPILLESFPHDVLEPEPNPTMIEPSQP